MSLYERLVILASKNLIIVEAISAFARKRLSLMVNNVENKPSICGNDSNLLIVFYVQIMPDDFVMQLHRF